MTFLSKRSLRTEKPTIQLFQNLKPIGLISTIILSQCYTTERTQGQEHLLNLLLTHLITQNYVNNMNWRALSKKRLISINPSGIFRNKLKVRKLSQKTLWSNLLLFWIMCRWAKKTMLTWSTKSTGATIIGTAMKEFRKWTNTKVKY